MNKKLRVVVADDDAAIREFLFRALTALGHEVRAVSSGRTLLEACAAAAPDVIVSDVQMPDLDGVTAAELIRHSGTTPIVLLSGAWDRPTRERAAGLARVLCLTKTDSLTGAGTGDRGRDRTRAGVGDACWNCRDELSGPRRNVTSRWPSG